MNDIKRAEMRGYQRGYRAATHAAWPPHKTPIPPDEYVAAFLKSATALRDAADTICATLCEDDEFVLTLGPAIDALDRDMTNLIFWLAAAEPPLPLGDTNG